MPHCNTNGCPNQYSNNNKIYDHRFLCPKCVTGLDKNINEEVHGAGNQLKLKINCLNECGAEWISQPDVEPMKGLGNLFLSAAIAFSWPSFC